jgi:hypothetical protein
MIRDARLSMKTPTALVARLVDAVHWSKHKKLQEAEAADLRRLILAKLSTTGAQIDDGSLPKFMEFRFERRYLRYQQRAPYYGRVNGVFKAITAATGLALSGGVAIDTLQDDPLWQSALFVLGLLAVVVATIDQTWRPALRRDTYSKCRDELRREGWEYLENLGRYEDAKDEDELAKRFLRQVLADGRQLVRARGRRRGGRGPSDGDNHSTNARLDLTLVRSHPWHAGPRADTRPTPLRTSTQ